MIGDRMRRWVRTRVLAGGVMIAAASLIAVALPAVADSPSAQGMLLSSDGVTFTGAAVGSLFAARPVLVPGSSAEARLWVKNGSGQAADFTAELQGGGDGPVAVSLSADGSAAAAALGPIGLARDQVLALAVTVSLAPDAGNGAQGLSLPVGLALTLRGETVTVPVLPPEFHQPDSTATALPPASSSASPSARPTDPIEVEASGSTEPGATGDDVAGTSQGAGPSSGSEGLSYTGVATTRYLLIGGGILLLGLVLLLIARRRPPGH